MPDLRETTTKRVLKIVMTCNSGKNITWNIENPKNNIAYSVVGALVDSMIDDQFLLSSSGGNVVELSDAYYYTTNKVDLD